MHTYNNTSALMVSCDFNHPVVTAMCNPDRLTRNSMILL